MKAILHHYPEQNNHILVWFQKTKLSKNIFQINCFENIFFYRQMQQLVNNVDPRRFKFLIT